jgi:hypothetical protein
VPLLRVPVVAPVVPVPVPVPVGELLPDVPPVVVEAPDSFFIMSAPEVFRYGAPGFSALLSVADPVPTVSDGDTAVWAMAIVETPRSMTADRRILDGMNLTFDDVDCR